jgi:hypothetical protein
MKPVHTRRIRRALGTAALLALGTAGAQGKDQYLTLRTPQAAITARITDNSVVSPDIQVTSDGKNLRGRALDQVVFLTLDDNAVSGSVGTQLARLNIENENGVTDARGTFAGNLTHLRLSREELTGNVGACGYELKATEDGGYQGSRSCGGPPERPVVLYIPPALAQQGPAMTLATLALLLGS